MSLSNLTEGAAREARAAARRPDRGVRAAVAAFVHNYSWAHLSLGLCGNLMFFVGSIFFLPSLEDWKLWGVWLFILGSFLMLLGSLGGFLVGTLEREIDEGSESGA